MRAAPLQNTPERVHRQGIAAARLGRQDLEGLGRRVAGRGRWDAERGIGRMVTLKSKKHRNREVFGSWIKLVGQTWSKPGA